MIWQQLAKCWCVMVADASAIARVREVIDSGIVRGLLASFWGFADQALISGANFLMMVLLARHLGPSMFGVFVLGYTLLMFVNSMQSALFTQPHNVLGATRTGRQYFEYTSATFVSQLVFSFACGLLIVATAGVIHLTVGSYAALLLGVAFASVTWQIQEYCRRVFYTQGNYLAAFTNDLVTYGGQAISILVLWHVGGLSTITALLSVGIASLVGAIVGMIRLRLALFHRISRNQLLAIVSENWIFSKWLLGSAVAKWTSSQLYPILTAGFVGVAATGGLRATQNLVAPTNIIVKTFESVSPPRAARAYRVGGFARMTGELTRFGGPLGVILVMYFAAISVTATHLVPWLLGDVYSDYSWLVWVYSLSYIVGYINLALSVALRSTGRTAPMFAANVVSAGLTLTIGIVIVREWGLIGAATGMIGHGLILLVILAIFTKKTKRLHVTDQRGELLSSDIET